MSGKNPEGQAEDSVGLRLQWTCGGTGVESG